MTTGTDSHANLGTSLSVSCVHFVTFLKERLRHDFASRTDRITVSAKGLPYRFANQLGLEGLGNTGLVLSRQDDIDAGIGLVESHHDVSRDFGEHLGADVAG